MEAVLFYCLKLTGVSAVLFLYYRLFLREKTFHRFNRFYLLGAMIVSMLLPLLKTSYFTVEVGENMYSLVHGVQRLQSVTNAGTITNSGMLTAVLAGIASFFTVKFFLGILKIKSLKNRFPVEKHEGIRLYRTDLENAPFSYFRNLFWKNTMEMESVVGQQVLKHELVHIKQWHTCDKVFTELVLSIFWFNPFFYFLKKELHLIHEYLADKEAVAGTDAATFAHMLLQSHFPGYNLCTASPLLSSDLKKRVYMLKKSKTKFSYVRRLLLLPVVFALLFVFLVNAQTTELRTVGSILMQHGNQDINRSQPETPATVSALSHTVGKTDKLFHRKAAVPGGENREQLYEAEAAASDAKAAAEQAELMRNEAELIQNEAALVREAALMGREEARLIKEQSELNKT